MYIWTGSCLFVIYYMACNWISSQVVNVLLIGPLFPFPWFSGVCVCISSCWMRFVVALFSRILSLRLNRFFRGWGLLVLCVVADGFCLDVAFTSGEGECLRTTCRYKL